MLSLFIVQLSQFIVIYTVKGFSVVNEAEVDVVLEFPCFLYDPVDVDSLPFLNQACTSEIYRLKYC